MSVDSTTIDRIVANVLQQLGARGDGARSSSELSTSDKNPLSRDPQRSAPAGTARIALDDRVITADLLAQSVNGAAIVAIAPKAILTPSARDFIKERGLRIDRGAKSTPPAVPASLAGTGSAAAQPSTHKSHPLLVVVRSTDAVTKLWTDLQATWSRELLGCPDDAAALAIREIARGATKSVVILAEQTHRAACLANRNSSVKAVAIRDAGEIALVRRQLRANVWCIDPTPKSWFELRNVLSAIAKS